MKKFLKTAALLLTISVAASCSLTNEGSKIDAQTADSLRRDSIARMIINTKDSIVHAVAEQTADQMCDSTLIDSIIATFDQP